MSDKTRLRAELCAVRFLFAATAIIGLLLPSYGQEVCAGITGTVTDPTGAVVPNVSVTARDIDRGTAWPTTTNDSGIYAYTRLPAGNYELKFEAKGFKTATRSGINLEVNQRARVDIAMEVGQVTETLEVSAAAPLLQTDTTIVGSTITTNTLVNTPLISRNYISLTLLTPGVTTTNPLGVQQ